jgi:hypothetical protein
MNNKPALEWFKQHLPKLPKIEQRWEMFKKFIYGVLLGTAIVIIIFDFIDSPNQSIKSPIPITPTIEIRINQDGTRDTTYIYTN